MQDQDWTERPRRLLLLTFDQCSDKHEKRSEHGDHRESRREHKRRWKEDKGLT